MTRRRDFAGRLALTALASGVLWSGTAKAQDTNSAKTAPVPPAASTSQEQGNALGGDIVVTAQRRSENLMRVPIAISAFGGETLKATGIGDVQGLQMVTPALVYPSTGAYAQPYIRGIGSRLLQNGLDPSVATYVDGRYISRQSAIVLDLADVQRVEVLKGPQGVLFGRNASAGAIRVITNEVSDKLEGSARLSYGNYNAVQAEAMVNVPLSDTLGVRIAALESRRDPFAKNLVATGNPNWDDKNIQMIRGKLRWHPAGSFESKLTLGYWTQDDNSGNDTVALGVLPLTQGIAVGGITGTSVNHVATALTGANRKREYSGEWDNSVEVGSVTLRSVTTYADLNNKLTFDGDGTSARLVDATVYERSKTFSQELQAASGTGGRLQWIVGGFYFNDLTDFDTVVDIGTRNVSQGQQNVKTESYAVFGQATYNIMGGLDLIAGGRYSKDIKTVDLLASQHDNAVTVPPTPYMAHNSWAKFTPSATLQYSFGDSLVYAKFARGFKSGGYSYPAYCQVPLKPETLDMYELGLKTQLFDHAVKLTLSGYYYNYTDLQVSRAAGTGAGIIVVNENAGSAKLYGLDADATWNITRQLSVTGSVALQHSEYGSYLASAKMYRGILASNNTPGMVDVGFDATGHELLRAPSFSAFAAVNYEPEFSGGSFPMSLTYAYKGAFDFDFVLDPSTSVLRQKAYSLVNGRIGFSPPSKNWTVSAWVKNLANAKYFDDVVAAGVGIRGSYGAPRTYGVEASFKF